MHTNGNSLIKPFKVGSVLMVGMTVCHRITCCRHSFESVTFSTYVYVKECSKNLNLTNPNDILGCKRWEKNLKPFKKNV